MYVCIYIYIYTYRQICVYMCVCVYEKALQKLQIALCSSGATKHLVRESAEGEAFASEQVLCQWAFVLSGVSRVARRGYIRGSGLQCA